MTVINDIQHLNKISAHLLLTLDSLEQRLEVTSAEAGEIMSLNDLHEDSRAVHQVLQSSVCDCNRSKRATYLGEQLQEVAILIEVDENIQAPDGLKVFLQLQSRLLQTRLHIFIICGWDLDELDAARFEVGDVPNNVVRHESNVLDTGSVVEVNILLNLGLLLALGGLVDGHLHNLVGGGHDDTLQGGEFTEIVSNCRSRAEAITYVQICESSTDQNLWKPRAFS